MAAQSEVGRRVRALREQAGLQAQELAALVGMTPSVLSNIERGKRSVKSAELAKLADALGVSALALLDENSMLARLPVATRAIDGEIEASPVLRRLTALAELSEVLSEAGLPARPRLDGVPAVDHVAWKSAADQLADWTRQRFSAIELGSDPPFDQLVCRIQTALGIDVLVERHEDPLLGAALSHRGFPLVFVNATQPRQRALFTLAHELGHVLIGASEPLTTDADLRATNDAERLANAFAASLLMPESEIRSCIEQYGRGATGLGQMLTRFGVSFESLVYRLHNLQIINAAGRDRLRGLGVTRLVANLDDEDLVARLISHRSADVDRVPPFHLIGRCARGWLEGVVSIRPLAGLLDVDADVLLEELTTAQDNALDEDFSTPDADATDESLYADSPI